MTTQRIGPCREEIMLTGPFEARLQQPDDDLQQMASGNFDAQYLLAPGAAWNDQHPDLHNYMGGIWYKTRFAVPQHWRAKRVVLHMGAANWNCRAWLNGRYIGEHSGGYISFELDATESIRPAASNTLVLLVDMKLSRQTVLQDGVGIGHWTGYGDKFPPASGDYFPWGGLIRPIRLVALPEAHIVIRHLRAEFDPQTGNGTLEWSVEPVNGTTLTVSVADRAGSGFQGRLELPAVKPWSAEQPNLYDAVFQLHAENGQVVDAVRRRVGFRKLEISGQKLLVNGKEVHLQGCSRHDDFAVLGAGLSLPVLLRDMYLMKWLGINTFRAGHYPASEELLDLADELGFYIIEECPANAIGHSRKKDETFDALIPQGFQENHKRYLREMINRDAWRPCIIAWSIANEPNSVRQDVADYLRSVRQYVRSLDDRPVVFTSCVGTDDLAIADMDIVYLNTYYFAWRCGNDYRIVQHTLHELCEHFSRAGKPIIIGEFGFDAVAGWHGLPGVLFTEEGQAEHIMKYLDVFESKPYVIGTLIWVFADFLVSQHFGRARFNHKGLFTRDREPKLAAHLLRQRWQMPREQRSNWRPEKISAPKPVRDEELWQ